MIMIILLSMRPGRFECDGDYVNFLFASSTKKCKSTIDYSLIVMFGGGYLRSCQNYSSNTVAKQVVVKQNTWHLLNDCLN